MTELPSKQLESFIKFAEDCQENYSIFYSCVGDEDKRLQDLLHALELSLIHILEDFRRLFEMVEASSFLKGQNNRNWTATFDWLIADANMAKVLDGNYKDKPQSSAYSCLLYTSSSSILSRIHFSPCSRSAISSAASAGLK